MLFEVGQFDALVFVETKIFIFFNFGQGVRKSWKLENSIRVFFEFLQQFRIMLVGTQKDFSHIVNRVVFPLRV